MATRAIAAALNRLQFVKTVKVCFVLLKNDPQVHYEKGLTIREEKELYHFLCLLVNPDKSAGM